MQEDFHLAPATPLCIAAFKKEDASARFPCIRLLLPTHTSAGIYTKGSCVPTKIYHVLTVYV